MSFAISALKHLLSDLTVGFFTELWIAFVSTLQTFPAKSCCFFAQRAPAFKEWAGRI